MTKEIKTYYCGICRVGYVDQITKTTKKTISIWCEKCDHCKHHYGLKEFWNANLKEVKK